MNMKPKFYYDYKSYHKLYNFLREMEFNRLLSSAISAYGEPNLTGIKNDKYYK